MISTREDLMQTVNYLVQDERRRVLADIREKETKSLCIALSDALVRQLDREHFADFLESVGDARDFCVCNQAKDSILLEYLQSLKVRPFRSYKGAHGYIGGEIIRQHAERECTLGEIGLSMEHLSRVYKR